MSTSQHTSQCSPRSIPRTSPSEKTSGCDQLYGTEVFIGQKVLHRRLAERLFKCWHSIMSLFRALLEHYVDYLSAPEVILTLTVVTGPILYSVYKDSRGIFSPPASSPVPGCRRLGMRKGESNLKDQYKLPPSGTDSKSRVKALFTYPIKSCCGVELPASEVDDTGLKFDRLFTFAQQQSKQAAPDGVSEHSTEWQHEWRFITAREHPRLALLKTELWLPDPRLAASSPTAGHKRTASDDSSHGIGRSRSRGRKGTLVMESAGIDADLRRKFSMDINASDWAANGGCLIISFPFEPDFNPLGLRTETVSIKIPLTPTPERAALKTYITENVTFWKDKLTATNVTNEIDGTALEKLKYFLGISKPLALFRRDDSALRAVTRNLPEELADGRFSIGFPDSYSAHILNLASVRALDAQLPPGASMKGKLDARRFRANIFIEGPPAFAEDNWQRASIGRCLRPSTELSRRDRSVARKFNDGTISDEADFLFGRGTARCTLPNVDPDLGVKDEHEPYATLKRTRRTDEKDPSKAYLGMQIVPLFEYGLIRVGDTVNVYENVQA